ncbi:hypothetical protein A9Q74_15070 [Colwellia sp. 39_35_sub15_T18]|nr:hypothetical protein A9Q74_15070 [Colwellia sp. 39_35_sub15_T18]
MSKHEENRLKKAASLKDRATFLDNFEENIEEYLKDEELILALAKQENWSKFSGYNFMSMSRNSYKDAANTYLSDGYEKIDKLRKSALTAINNSLIMKEKVPRIIRADTKEGMRLTIKAQESQLSIVREANLVLSKAIEVTVDALDKLAKETRDDDIKDIIESEMSKVKSLLRRNFKLKDADIKKSKA